MSSSGIGLIKEEESSLVSEEGVERLRMIENDFERLKPFE